MTAIFVAIWGAFITLLSDFLSQKQQTQINRDAANIKALQDKMAIGEDIDAMSDADVDKQLRTDSAARAPKS